MTSEEPETDADRPDGTARRPFPETDDEFRQALRDLVRTAAANGVDVRGGWPVAGEGDELAWDVEITKIARRTTARVTDTGFPASAVVDAVAAREGVDPVDLPPLYDAIGPDLLEIFDEADDAGRRVTFEYCGYRITVGSDGSITVDG